MKTIIVPTDFSAISKNAARYAMDMAAALGTEVTLLYVVSIPIQMSEIDIPTETFDTMVEDSKADMDDLKNELAARNSNVNINSVVVMGRLLDEITYLAERADVLAIVMGTQGATAAQRLLLGSNATAAIHHLPYPVMLIPAGAAYKPVSRIAFACDMHDTARIPVQQLINMVTTFNAQLEVINVSAGEAGGDPEMLPGALTLQRELAPLHPKINFAAGLDIVSSIASYIHDNNTGLLAFIPKDHGILGTIFHKSISNNLAAHIDIPMMSLSSGRN
jgi:nucleotide-binding universal stress UspA family protein